ncbi:MAG: NAD(P)-binding protein [Candidatus Margulisbacteria bacterium]|nr:NAD(P)-binding protein [Candidatus Margulisiibacteriota bacterium]
MKKALIFGAGFAGCTIAHLLKEEGWDCTIIERENVIGGGCRTHFYGGHPFTYGPRPYYGYSEKVYNWIDSFAKMRRFPFSLLSYVEQDQRFYSYPIHEDDIPQMRQKEQINKELKQADNSKQPKDFEEYWINRVGPTLYNMFVNQYSKKMWMIDSNKELDTFNWSAKDRPIDSGSKECYKDSIIGYPVGKAGYNEYFEKTAEGTKLIVGEQVKDVDLKNKSVKLSDGTILQADIIVSSIPLEELCSGAFGDLPYVGRDFLVFVLPCKQIFPGNIRFCHYTQSEPFTRIVEYKKLTYYESDDTLLGLEIPSKRNKLYPYMIKKYLDRAKQYLDSLPQDIYSIGRAGTYKYSTIEQTIVQAFEAYKKITGKEVDGLGQEFYKIGDVSLIKSRK